MYRDWANYRNKKRAEGMFTGTVCCTMRLSMRVRKRKQELHDKIKLCCLNWPFVLINN